MARYYQQEARVQDALREQQRVWLTQQARTADGIRIEIAANIAHSVEAQAAFGNGAEGVGLFRTEMLYMDRTSAPGESELYNIFCQALESANGRSIIVRTMDIGGDKPVDYLNIPAKLTRSSVIARCVFMKNTRRCLPHNYGRSCAPLLTAA